jgi:hypothetical protein
MNLEFDPYSGQAVVRVVFGPDISSPGTIVGGGTVTFTVPSTTHAGTLTHVPPVSPEIGILSDGGVLGAFRAIQRAAEDQEATPDA